MKTKKIISIILCVLLVIPTLAVGVFAQTDKQLESGFIESGDTKIEYAVYGSYDKKPLVLLSPNGSDMHFFDNNILPEMAEHFMVITISPRGTGKTAKGEQQITFEEMSNDLLNVLDYFQIEKANIYGFSDGGNLGLVFAVQHQDRINKLAVMGANINPLGTRTVIQALFVIEYIFMSIKAIITKDAEDERVREIQGLMITQPNLSFGDLKSINVPVLNMFGEFDVIKRTHSKLITKSIPNARELMIVGGGHTSSFDYTDKVINPALLEFFGV